MSPATRRIRVVIALVLPLLAIGASAGVASADLIFLRLQTETGQLIQGDATLEGEANSIELLSVSIPSLQTPVDPSTIRVTGRPQWTGLVLTKKFERSSPRLLEAFFRQTPFRSAELRFYRLAADQIIRLRTWVFDRGVFLIGLSSSASSGPGPDVVVEQLHLWSCQITFREDSSNPPTTGTAQFC
jgi:hypothetical protein